MTTEVTEGFVTELKELIIKALDLEDIAPEDIERDAPLFGDGLGLDSIDALEIGVCLQKRYGLRIDADSEDTKRNFFSIQSLAEFVMSNRTG